MKDKTITLDGKEMLLVNERISIDQSDVVYVFFDGESTYEIKKSQYDEMSKSGRLVITSTNPYLNYIKTITPMKTWQEKFNELYELTKTFGYLENEFPSEKNIDDEEKHKVIFKDFIQSEKKLSFLEGRTCKQNEIDHHVQHKLNRQLEAIEKEIQAKRKELGFSVDPRTGEYRWGESPSSVCRDCGQKRKSESQGYNQAIDDIKQIINKYKQNL